MAGDEHQPQQIVADVVVERRVEIRDGSRLSMLELVSDRFVLALEHLPAPELVDRPVLGRAP